MMIAETTRPDARYLEAARDQALAKIRRRAKAAGSAFLHATTNGSYLPIARDFWTSGFWPGLLNLALTDETDAGGRALAKEAEESLFDMLQTDEFYELHHDVGFQFMPTAVMRFKQTGDRDARRRGIVAAQLLAGRFNVNSQAIEAWNGAERGGYSIIDTVMNLPLLFWASKELGEPRYANMARLHLQTVMREFVRPDFTTHHIVQFDRESGKRVAAHGGQGDAPDSAWSRGQAWAIYGLAIAARYTADARYAALSRKIADRFLSLNAPHGVPPWDFFVEDVMTAPRDSSAAAITACGLLELSELGDPEAKSEAMSLLTILTERVACLDDSEDGILLEATSALPHGKHISDSLIYGDYYYYEALLRLTGSVETCW